MINSISTRFTGQLYNHKTNEMKETNESEDRKIISNTIGILDNNYKNLTRIELSPKYGNIRIIDGEENEHILSISSKGDIIFYDNLKRQDFCINKSDLTKPLMDKVKDLISQFFKS